MSNIIWQPEPLRIRHDHKDDLLRSVSRAISGGFTGLIVEGESAGVYACNFLQQAGYRLPEDFSVICWETPEVSKLISPGITTIGQDFNALADCTMNIMEAVWAGEEPPFVTTVPYLFHQRNSTAAV